MGEGGTKLNCGYIAASGHFYMASSSKREKKSNSHSFAEVIAISAIAVLCCMFEPGKH